MHEITKDYGRKAKITGIISLLLNIGPMLYFVIAGFIQGGVEQRVVLGLTGIAALVLGVIMMINKAKLGRSLF